MMTYRCIAPLLLLAAIVCAAPQSQQEREIVKAFNKTVAAYIPTHIAREPVVHHVGCGWNKQYYEASADYRIDVRKTDSLVSPYIGVVQFGVFQYFSACHKTEEEAKKDNAFPTHLNDTHKYTFAYQDDTWIIKSREVRFDSIDADSWSPCGPYEGCV